MHVVFINFYPFKGNSGIHIHPLANEFRKRGHDATVYVPDNDADENGCFFTEPALYLIRPFSDDTRLSHQGDLIFVAWTPREIVRKKTEELAMAYNAPYVVHLEDNEECLVETHLNLRIKSTGIIPLAELDRLIPNGLSHPFRYKEFLNNANGATCIIKNLEQFVPKHVPALTFWPACERDIFDLPRESNFDVRLALGIPEDAKVIFYPGNVHSANREEVLHLYRAVENLANSGRDIYLIRAGENVVPLEPDVQTERPCFKELGNIAPQDMLQYLSVSDILVQPGPSNDFNDYRFPSKLPMFLASGRPVITTNSNIGAHLTNWENCLHTTFGNSEELAHKIEILINHPTLAAQIGQKGREYAQLHFDWKLAANNLISFYSTILKRYGREVS